jgi:hypothetical protein
VNKEQFERERRYQSAVSVARTMLRRQLITEDEFKVIDTMFLEKYRPILGGLIVAKTAKNLDFKPF